MSLITLTFNGQLGSDANQIGRGKIKILKTEKFVGSEEVCVIGRLVEGAVSKKMQVSGKNGCQVISVESKYGDGACAREGAQVVLMIAGIRKDELAAGTEVLFEKGIESIIERPKGRLIIA